VSLAEAQIIDPYYRVVDPRAIARLDLPDNHPLIYRTGFGLPKQLDSNGAHILAEDSGSGVITHFWATTDTPDSLTKISIYIDGKLVISTSFYSFFQQVHGMLRPPLDSLASGAYVCDVQMPFRKGFKILYESGTNNFYYAIAWRRIEDSSRLLPFSLDTTTQLAEYQKKAERGLRNQGNPWAGVNYHQQYIDTLIPGDTLVVFDMQGPKMLQALRVQLSNYDHAMDSFWVEMFWDKSPFPSVKVPLSDFFGAGTGVWKMRSLQLTTDTDSGLICYFPMPFYYYAHIHIINRSTQSRVVTASTQYSLEPINRSSYGYFQAQFNETNPTRYGVHHPVLHTKGRGHFIGMNLAIPNIRFAVALEGDPLITVDTTKDFYIRYTGGEDYFNGGWWFLKGIFTHPFAGYIHRVDAFYRFHYLDAIDYSTSLDFLLQHGVNNDIKDHYKTVAYYYQHWTPFWISRDTIRKGETFFVGGSGYNPHQTIEAKLGSNILFTLTANEKGEFHKEIYDLLIPAGTYALSVNGEERPTLVTVYDRPRIRIVKDEFIPVVKRANDTVHVVGNGFYPGEKVTFSLDSIPVVQQITSFDSSSYRLEGWIIVPYLADWDYHVVAKTERDTVLADDLVKVTRVRNYEFEDLYPPIEKSPSECWTDIVSFFWYAKWSMQSLVYFKPKDSTGYVTFKFVVPYADTFRVDLFSTVGKSYGKYYYFIDDYKKGHFDGYKKLDYDPRPSDTLHAGIMYLAAGEHTVKFVGDGKKDSAEDYMLGPDHIVLTPVTTLAPSPGTFRPVDLSIPEFAEVRSCQIFPNPSRKSDLTLFLSFAKRDSDLLHQALEITVRDILGRVVYSQQGGVTSSTQTIPLRTSLLPGTYRCTVHLRESNTVMSCPFLILN